MRSVASEAILTAIPAADTENQISPLPAFKEHDSIMVLHDAVMDARPNDAHACRSWYYLQLVAGKRTGRRSHIQAWKSWRHSQLIDRTCMKL